MKNVNQNFYVFLFMAALMFVVVSCNTDSDEDLIPVQEIEEVTTLQAGEAGERHSGIYDTPVVGTGPEEVDCEPSDGGGYKLVMKRSFWEANTPCVPSTTYTFVLPNMDECECQINEFRTEHGNTDCTEIAQYCHWVECTPTDRCNW